MKTSRPYQKLWLHCYRCGQVGFRNIDYSTALSAFNSSDSYLTYLMNYCHRTVWICRCGDLGGKTKTLEHIGFGDTLAEAQTQQTLRELAELGG